MLVCCGRRNRQNNGKIIGETRLRRRNLKRTRQSIDGTKTWKIMAAKFQAATPAYDHPWKKNLNTMIMILHTYHQRHSRPANHPIFSKCLVFFVNIFLHVWLLGIALMYRRCGIAGVQLFSPFMVIIFITSSKAASFFHYAYESLFYLVHQHWLVTFFYPNY